MNTPDYPQMLSLVGPTHLPSSSSYNPNHILNQPVLVNEQKVPSPSSDGFPLSELDWVQQYLAVWRPHSDVAQKQMWHKKDPIQLQVLVRPFENGHK